ncbi:MAG: DNA polymerase III subunit delta [Bacteroidetes bacterium]|nr:DNA polymerase III subunit delta [Bacteroidota bacterium]
MPRGSDSTALFESIRSSVRAAEFPVFYLYGDEPFYIELLQKEAEKLLPPGQSDFNLDLLYGNDADPSDVLAVLRSYPMMADRRVVIIRDFLQLKGSGEKGGKGGLESFADYFANPNPTTLLFIVERTLPDGRTTLGKSLRKKNSPVRVAAFEKLPDSKLTEWVMMWCRQAHGKTIDALAANMLAQMVGNQLQLLAAEIEKIAMYQGDAEEISPEDVKRVVGHYREYTTFELKDAIVKRDVTRAMLLGQQILSQSQSDPGELIRTVAFFSKLFTELWQITRLKSKGLSKQQIQNELGIHANAFYYKWQEAHSFRFDEMPFIFEALLDADQALKGHTTMDSSSILLLLIQRLAGGRKLSQSRQT